MQKNTPHLSERNLKIIHTIGRFRYLSSHQVWKEFYPTSTYENATKRLTDLARYGFLSRDFAYPKAVTNPGKRPTAIYFLSAKNKEHLRAYLTTHGKADRYEDFAVLPTTDKDDSDSFSNAHLVHEILLNTGLPAHRLELEITETALVRDRNRALATLRQLKALGVRIAVDDFGTGYSSLYNLRTFPFDKIKIDRSLIKSVDINDEAAMIFRAVLGLGHGLGLPVLAEGVETRGELEFLSTELCDEVQGYLLGKPAGIGNFRYLTHDDVIAELEDAAVAS